VFHRWSGNGTGRPSRTSVTVAGTSSPHFGKLTKMRPPWETVTPVGMGPSKVATVSSVPTGSSLKVMSLLPGFVDQSDRVPDDSRPMPAKGNGTAY
jgi:hypothetical protein